MHSLSYDPQEVSTLDTCHQSYLIRKKRRFRTRTRMSDSVKNPPRTRILILEEHPLLRHGIGDYLKPLATSSRGSLRYATHQENEPVMEMSDLFVAVAAPSAFAERPFGLATNHSSSA